jgi:hypothetical protein
LLSVLCSLLSHARTQAGAHHRFFFECMVPFFSVESAGGSSLAHANACTSPCCHGAKIESKNII